MAEDFAIGKELEIPKSVLDNIDKIDKKINDISKDSELMAQHFGSAMIRMGNGADVLLKKMQQIQSLVNSFNGTNTVGLNNISNGMLKTATEAERVADSVSKAATAMNKFNNNKNGGYSSYDAERKAYIEKYDMYKRMFDQIERNERKALQASEKEIKAAEKQAKAQERLNKAQEQRTNNNAINAYNRAMASSEALITQRINKIAKLRQAEEMLTKASGNYSTQISKIRSEIERLNKLNQGQVDSYGKIIKSHQNLMNTSDQLMRKLALIFSVSQIQGYLMNLVKVRGEFELQNTALASILQNKDKADKLFAQITELAVKSPFTLKELTTYTKSLSAYQVEYEKLYDTTKMLADISAGLGVDMQRLILAFGQVKAANVLRGTEVRQFTEAGFNILGELAKYYTELEGKMVTVGEVQDRVTKKMVAFGDVEEVFKRVTSAGGIFYNMQERQAETLAGQMSNLQDSIDIMLNDIGKANDGIIKNIVASVRTIVENWEIFANLINAASVGFVLYTAKVLLAAKANNAFAASSIAATAAQSGLVGATAKTIKVFNSLIAFAKANPFVMIASAVAYLGYELYNHVKKVEENKKAYDVLVNSVKETEKSFNSITSKIEEQNEKIRKSLDSLESIKKGTKEYYEVESEANKEREKLNTLLNDLKNKFPEVYSGIVKQKDGTVDLTSAQKILNEELEKTTYLSYLSRQTETFWNEGLVENIKDASKEQQNYKSSMDNVSSGFIQMSARIKEYFATNKYASKELQKQLEDIAKSSMSTYDKIQKVYFVVSNTTGVNIGDLRDIIYDYQEEARKAEKANDALNDSNGKLSESIKQIAEGYKSAFDISTEEGRKSAQKATEEFIRLLDIKDEAVRKFVQTQFEVNIGVKLNIEGKVEKQFSDMEKRVNDYLKSKEFSLVPKVEAGEGTSKYFNDLKNEYKDLVEEAEKIKRANQELYPDKTNAQRLDELNKKMVQVKNTLKDWGELEEKRTKTSKQNPELKRLKDQIALIKKAGEEYKKLRQYFSEEDATKQIRESFADAFSNLDLDIAMSFDTEGVVKGIENLTYKTIQGGKKAVDEALAPLQSEQDIKVKAEGLDKIKDQLDELFAGYELSVELEKMGVDKNIISKLFNVEIFDLNELRKSIKPLESELAKFGDKGVSLWDDMNKKISQAERKELEERMKTFVKYLEKTMDETKRIQSKAAKDISFANILFGEGKIDSTQYAEAISQIQRKANEELSKVSVERFKESPEYIKAMGDMSMYSRKELERLSEQLQKLIADSASFSSASDLKVYQDALNKVNEQIGNIKTPFDESFIGQIRKAKELQNEYNAELERYNSLLNQKAQKESELQSALETLQSLEARRDSGDNSQDLLQQISNAQEGVKLATQSLGGVNNQLNISQGKLSSISSSMGGIMQGAQGALGMVDMIVKGVYQAINATIEMFNEIKDLADSFGVNTEEGGWSDWTIAMNALGDMNEKVMGAWESLKSGDIAGSIVKSFGAVFSVIKGINSLFDNKREKEIQRQMDLVESLQLSYKKLEEAIEGAYSIDTYKSSYNQTIANLEAQNESYRQMIAAEQDKKKTDDDRIKEWQNQIQDNLDRIQELEEQFYADLGGFGSDANVKSAAQEFADAWLEAYMETGDGLDALSDKWDEYIQNVVAKQLMLKGAEKYLKPVMDMLDGMLQDSVFTPKEAEEIQNKIDQVIPQLNEFWKAIAGSFDLGAADEGDTMSGLSKSISGITEETADALAAITESIRYFSADTNVKVSGIYNFLLNPPVESPLFAEMKMQTEHLRLMYNLWSSMSKSKSGVQGRVLKVEVV